jgi:hypothetical protein
VAYKRLSIPSGEINAGEAHEGDADDKIVRSAILVHSAPNGEPAVFQSADGEISFDAARIKRVVDNHNARIQELAQQYGGLDKMPIGAFPPILDQHESDSTHRVSGRLAGLLKFETRDVPGVGPQCACATTDITFLGKDTVSRVKDGRIYHLSIGIDEAGDTLGEVSTVIEPAAPGAMLLNRNKKPSTQGVKRMAKKNARLEAQKKARLAKLSAIKDSMTSLGAKTEDTTKRLVSADRENKVTARLSGLMKSKKLTPAEFKQMDVKKLAKLDDEALNTVVSTFEARQDVILAGQRGSTDAVDFATLGKDLEKRQQKRLASETVRDLKKLGAKLKPGSRLARLAEAEDEDHGKTHEMSGPHEEELHPGKDPHAVAGEGGDEPVGKPELSHLHAKLAQHLAAGDIEGAKAVHAEMAKHLSSKHLSSPEDVAGEGHGQDLAGLKGEMDEFKTQLARCVGMVEELMSVEKEEGHDLAADPEHEEGEKHLEHETEEDLKGKK